MRSLLRSGLDSWSSLNFFIFNFHIVISCISIHVLICLCSLQVFEKWLLDAEWSLNAGNWMWLSCSAFFQQFFNCICPVAFGRKLDPNGDYIRLVKNFLTFIIKMLNAF